MKKLLLSITALFLLSITAVSAQGFQGKWWVMGQAGFGTEADGNIKNYSILPVVGVFIAPATTVGLGVGYLGSTDETSSTTKLTNGVFIAQPLVRQYFPVAEKLMIFGQASVPLQFGKATMETGNVKTDAKFTSYGIEIAPGVDYFLSDHFTIEATFGLINWNSTKPKGGDATNDFGIGLNSGFLGGVNFGLKYIF